MTFVVDANILVAGFLRSRLTRELLLDERLTLLAPEYAALETEKVLGSARIRKRLGGLEPREIRLLLAQLTASVRFYARSFYEKKLQQALSLAPHPEDAPYLALALVLEIPVWSNDLKLKEQQRIRVCTTQELVELLRPV